jgi:hypothetical protein
MYRIYTLNVISNSSCIRKCKLGGKYKKKQGQRKVWRIPLPKNLTVWPWPWKSIGFQILLRTNYVPSLVKIHWRMLILECSQGCYEVKIWPLDLWPWKSIGLQTLLRTKYVPSLVKIHWKMLILECSQGCYRRTDSSVTISLHNFVGEGIIKLITH